MSLLRLPALFFCLALLPFCEAQFPQTQIPRRRRSSAGRIIAGCVVAAVAALFLLCLLLLILRKRRARSMHTTPGIGQNTLGSGKPLFGGPWGRTNGRMNQGPNLGNQPSNFNGGLQGQTQTPYNPEYPSQNAPPPPPAYPPQDQYNYAAPPGPPPAAYHGK